MVSLPDKVTPVIKQLALVPLSRGAIINSSSLIQRIPLFRDKMEFISLLTLSVMGDFGIAIQALIREKDLTQISIP